MGTKLCGIYLCIVNHFTEKPTLKRPIKSVDDGFFLGVQYYSNVTASKPSPIEHNIQIHVLSKKVNYLISLRFGKFLKMLTLPRLNLWIPLSSSTWFWALWKTRWLASPFTHFPSLQTRSFLATLKSKPVNNFTCSPRRMVTPLQSALPGNLFSVLPVKSLVSLGRHHFLQSSGWLWVFWVCEFNRRCRVLQYLFLTICVLFIFRQSNCRACLGVFDNGVGSRAKKQGQQLVRK